MERTIKTSSNIGREGLPITSRSKVAQSASPAAEDEETDSGDQETGSGEAIGCANPMAFFVLCVDFNLFCACRGLVECLLVA